jgi:hypothetical protein
VKITAHAAIDFAAREFDGESQMAPPVDPTSLGDGCARPNPIERVAAPEVRSGTEGAAVSRPERPADGGNGAENDDLDISMILSIFEEPFFNLENIIAFGVKVLSFLLAGFVFPWVKPLLQKWALRTRPYSTLLYRFIWEVSESPFLNHGAGIRIFCCLLLFCVFVGIKVVTAT